MTFVDNLFKSGSKFSIKPILILVGIFFMLNIIYSKYKEDKNATLSAPIKTYILFDSTFSIKSPFPISKDTIIPNSNRVAFDKVLYSSYFSDNISLNIVMYKYRMDDTVYRKMAEAYLQDGDDKSFIISKIIKQDTIVINGKKFLQLEGNRKSTNTKEYKDYISKNFTFLINKSSPNLYFVYFEENLHSAEMDSVKKTFFRSIRIKGS